MRGVLFTIYVLATDFAGTSLEVSSWLYRSERLAMTSEGPCIFLDYWIRPIQWGWIAEHIECLPIMSLSVPKADFEPVYGTEGKTRNTKQSAWEL